MKVVLDYLVVLVAVVLEIMLVEVESVVKDMLEEIQEILVDHILVAVAVVLVKTVRQPLHKVVMVVMDIKFYLQVLQLHKVLAD